MTFNRFFNALLHLPWWIFFNAFSDRLFDNTLLLLLNLFRQTFWNRVYIPKFLILRNWLCILLTWSLLKCSIILLRLNIKILRIRLLNLYKFIPILITLLLLLTYLLPNHPTQSKSCLFISCLRYNFRLSLIAQLFLSLLLSLLQCCQFLVKLSSHSV